MSRRGPLRAWLKLDSGMHRVGLAPDTFTAADATLSRHEGITELIHMTHFSSADHSTSVLMDQQLRCFHECRSLHSRAKSSLANSAALISRADTHGDWVRPGVMLISQAVQSDANAAEALTFF